MSQMSRRRLPTWLRPRWLTRLGEKGHRYHDGVPGDLMDAIDAVATLRSGKL